MSKVFGLSEKDAKNATKYLEHNEYGLCYETVIDQMYENDIEITPSFNNFIVEQGEKMELQLSNYSFMEELARDESNIPKLIENKSLEL